MKNKKVLFTSDVMSSKERIGVITDKVNIPIASGSNGYCPMDNYVIIENETKEVFIVNPICIKKIFKVGFAENDFS